MVHPTVTVTHETSCSLITLSGNWIMDEDVPAFIPLHENVAALSGDQSGIVGDYAKIICNGEAIGQWDTSLVAYLFRCNRWAEAERKEVHYENMPSGVLALLDMIGAPRTLGTAKDENPMGVAEKLGQWVLAAHGAVFRVAEFTGELCLSLVRAVKRQAFFRWKDFLSILYDVGPGALPIITLISFLVGLILAFVGAIQLRQFGAQIFVADLVGIAMAREMGGMMTAIIMAGRSSAAYAARIGTMQVNEEVDALRTAGLNAFDFLVLPRMIALLMMLPLLTLYAMAIGILGGMCIGIFMLDLTATEYIRQTISSTSINHFTAGFLKSFLFALVIAGAGCYHGLRCGRSSESVGKVTTIAVVAAIVGIVVTDSVMTLVYDALGY